MLPRHKPFRLPGNDVNDVSYVRLGSRWGRLARRVLTPRACATLSSGAAHGTIGFGISQSGRFLRTFLDLGFNQDENGNRVFDGLDPEIASYRISLNIRFAQPTRLAGTQHTEKQFPGQESPPGATNTTVSRTSTAGCSIAAGGATPVRRSSTPSAAQEQARDIGLP